MKLRDLFVSIGFDVDDKALRHLDRGLANTKRLALALGAGVVATSALMYKMASSVAVVGDHAAKTAGKLGLNVEALQEYHHVAQLAGMSVADLNANFERGIRRSAEAAQGAGEAKDAYKKLGIKVTDATGKMRPFDQIMSDLAERFSAMTDENEKVRLAYDLFGRSGIGMINMLNQGSAALKAQRTEARALGIVLSEQAAKDAEKFQDELLRTKSVLIGLKNYVGIQLMPIAIRLMTHFVEWAKTNRRLIRSRLDKFLKMLLTLMRSLWRVAKAVGVVLSDLVELFGGLEVVIMAVIWAMGLLTGAVALSALGYLVSGVLQLITAFKALSVAAIAANASAALIPLLIGTGVAALILIWQDLISFFLGKDSILGVLLDTFEKKMPGAFKTAGKAILWLRDIVKAHNTAIITASETAAAWLKDHLPDAFKTMKERIQPYVSWLQEKLSALTGLLNTWRSRAGDKIAGVWESTQNFLGAGPANSPAGEIKYHPVPQQPNISIDAPITVTVPEGTPADDVGRRVKQGVSEGVERMLRNAAATLAPATER